TPETAVSGFGRRAFRSRVGMRASGHSSRARYTSAVRSVAGGLSAILVVIVLFGGLVRFVGIGRELPHRMEPDAPLVFQMQRMAGYPALVPRDHSTGPYPLLLARVLSWLPQPEVPARAEGPGDERAHLARSARPFLVVRIVVALFSVAGVLLAYPFARRF